MVRVVNRQPYIARNISSSNLVSFFLGQFIKKGKKVRIFKIFSKMFVFYRDNLSFFKVNNIKNPFHFLFDAFEQMKPAVLLKRHISSGKTVLLPVPVTFRKDYSKGFRLLLHSLKRSKMFQKNILTLLTKVLRVFQLTVEGKGPVVARKLKFYKKVIESRPLFRF